MENCKPVSTSLEAGRKFQQLTPSDYPSDVQTNRLGKWMPDLHINSAAAVGVLSQYMSEPSKDH